MLFLIAGMLLSGCGKNASDTTDISSVKLKSNQKIVIGKITEIAGNEMTYTILKKASNKKDSNNTSDQGQNSNDSNNTSDQNQNSNGSNNTSDRDGGNAGIGDMQNKNAQGQSPSGQGQPGNPPGQNGDGMQGQQNASSDNNTDSSNKSKSDTASKSRSNSDSKKSMTMYTSTNKSATMTIPVGTEVITSLGNKTTFSRLSNGDVIKMIVETDKKGKKVIVGIWMV